MDWQTVVKKFELCYVDKLEQIRVRIPEFIPGTYAYSWFRNFKEKIERITRFAWVMRKVSWVEKK